MTPSDPNALYWFVAYVKSCQEKSAAAALQKMGVEYYLPVRRVRRKYSDRTKTVDQLVIPRMIFIRTTLSSRILPLEQVPAITRYMVSDGPFTPVVVPDQEMAVFMRMVDGTLYDISVCQEHLMPGDMVEIIDGPMKGSRCELVTVDGQKRVAVRLSMLGCALVDMPAGLVKKIL